MLIGLHEFGHFLAAKLCGMTVLEFSIGMGPALFKHQGKSTLYSLRLLPLGGYCALDGEDGDSEAEGAFCTKPAWQRVIVLVAGSLMNLLTGIVILMLLFIGSDGYISTELTGFAEGFPYQGETMLLPGDNIKKINGYNIFLYADVSTFLEHDAGKPYTIEVERNGERVILRDLPLEKQLYTYTSTDEEGNEVTTEEYRYGLMFSVKPASFGTRLKLALLNALDFARLVKVSFFDLFRGIASVSELSGPVGIASMITETAQTSMPNMWMLVALIAVNLAVMNLLPIPALDGGRILFLLVGEAVLLLTGKPLNSKYEGLLNAIFLGALLLLMVYVSYNDILRLIRK